MIPSSSTNLNFVIDQAVESEIPVVTFNNDAPYSKRFCYIGHNNYEDGKKCANLIANMIDNRGEIIILSSNLEVYSLKQRVAGFRDKIKADYPDIKIAEIIENKDQRSYEYAKKQMGENNKIRGIFITTGGLTSKWPWFLENTDFKVQPKVIGYDNREETSQSLKDGLVHGLVHQNPYQQGYLAIKTLYECVAKGVKPDGENVYVESRIEII
jgi:ABC-type sugar transport system substrate-binding protein